MRTAGLQVDGQGLVSGACAPRSSGDEARNAAKNHPQDRLIGAGARQVQPDLGLQFNHPGGDLDQPQPQGVKLRQPPERALRHPRPQAPHQPIGARMQKQTELVRRRPRAGRAVGRQVGFPGLDVVFRRAAPTVDPLIERSSFAAGKIGDDEPGVAALLARFHTSDDTLDPAPTLGAVEELREAPHLAFGGSRGKACLGVRLQASDVPAQGGG